MMSLYVLGGAIVTAILSLLGALGYSRVTKAKASADVAAANQGQAEAQRDAQAARTQTAEVRDAQAQANAAAAQAGADAGQERAHVEETVGSAGRGALDGLVQKWAAPASGDTSGTPGAESGDGNKTG